MQLQKTDKVMPVSYTHLDVYKRQLLIYPNPVSDYFQIQTKEEIRYIEVFDLQGRLMKVFKNAGKKSKKTFVIEDLNS